MNIRILIIEDDEPSSYLLSYFLSFQGFSVRVANSGESGFELAQRELPDLIIMDYALPDTNACEMLQRLRESPHTKQIPVIVSSALPTIPQNCHAVVQTIARALLPKPIDLGALVPQIRTVLSGLNQ